MFHQFVFTVLVIAMTSMKLLLMVFLLVPELSIADNDKPPHIVVSTIDFPVRVPASWRQDSSTVQSMYGLVRRRTA